MSEVSVAHRQAMCLECGAVRTAKAQYIGRGSRKLRCQPCGRGTMHAAVNWDGIDPREEANRKRVRGDADTLRELDALMQLLQTCGVEVTMSTEADGAESEPMGGLVDVVRWLEPETYQLRLQGGLSMADRVYCLDWAWNSMRPAVARWHRCPVEVDVDGESFQRIYNNGLELGIFTRS